MAQSQQMIEDLHDCYIKTAANIISYYGDNELKEKLQELRDIVQNNCIADKKLASLENTKNNLLQSYDDESTETDIESIVQEYKNSITEINTDTSDDNRLINFDKQVEALLDKVKDDEDNEDMDIEMQLTGGYVTVIDPISKKRIVDPVKNTVCGHTYDRESITQLLKLKKKTKCPVIGCISNQFVKLEDLRVDIVTKTYLEKNPA